MSVTNYTWDGENILLETDENDAVTAEYTYEPRLYGNLVSEHRDGTTYTHYYDSLGSTLALTGQTGAVSDTFTYDAWGNECMRAGSTETPFRWIGESGYFWCQFIGTHHCRRRNYLPTFGLWTSADPLQPFRKDYVYVQNSPLSATDPSGTEIVVVFAGDPDGLCSNAERACITTAITGAISKLRVNPDCLSRVVCPAGRASCDSEALTACIIDALLTVRIACSNRGTANCHAGETNAAHTSTDCSIFKSTAADGIAIPFLPCEPCGTPITFLNTCEQCPHTWLQNGVMTLCRDVVPGNAGGVASYCSNDANRSRLMALLVHEASHNCVGGHDTTGGAGKCDKCGRPDSYSIEATFKRC